LLASIVECRGAERFRLIYENIEDPDLKDFYHNLWASEAKHGNIFVKMSLLYFNKSEVYARLGELNEIESQVLDTLPVKAALH
jgi:tRNA-(ms[2]io[6]A)-hydroxylase